MRPGPGGWARRTTGRALSATAAAVAMCRLPIMAGSSGLSAKLRSGGARRRQMLGELARKDGGEKRQAGALGTLAVDRARAGQDVEPEPVDHGIQAAGDDVGLDLRIAAGRDDLLAQRAGLDEVALRQRLADAQVFRPPAG